MATTDNKKKTTASKKTTNTETKKVTTETVNVVDATNSEKSSIISENEALKEQVAKMQAQMEAVLAMMNGNMMNTAEKKNSNRLIRFVNLKNATVVLKGTNFWTIEGQYGTRDFPEKEARIIALNMSNYLRSGSVYIDDAEFVRENDLEAVYETLLSDSDLKTLLDKNATDVIETYQNVNENQKGIIIDAIIADLKAGRQIDNNILVTLGSLSGRDLINLEDYE